MSGGYEIVLWILLGIATVTDLLWGKVYNALTFSFIAAGLLYRLYQNGYEDSIRALAAVGVAFALFFPLWLIKAFAAGDIKLLMAVGAWADSKLVIQLGMVAILVGAVVGLFLLVKKNGIKGSAGSVARHLKERGDGLASYRMPFAPAFLCGFFLMKIAEMGHWNWI